MRPAATVTGLLSSTPYRDNFWMDHLQYVDLMADFIANFLPAADQELQVCFRKTLLILQIVKVITNCQGLLG